MYRCVISVASVVLALLLAYHMHTNHHRVHKCHSALRDIHNRHRAAVLISYPLQMLYALFVEHTHAMKCSIVLAAYTQAQ
jgi:hypothetical protein